MRGTRPGHDDRSRWRLRLTLTTAIAAWLVWAAPPVAASSGDADPSDASGHAIAPSPSAGPEPQTSADAPAPSLNDRLAALAKLEFDLERALSSALLDVASAKRRFEAAQQRLDGETDPDDLLREEVAVRRLELESAQRQTSLLESRIERRAAEDQTWRRLYALETGEVPPETLTEWLLTTETALDALAREAVVKRDRLTEVRRDLSYTKEQVQSLLAGSPEQRWARLRLRALEALEGGYAAELASIDSASAQQAVLAERIERAQQELPLSARLRGAIHYLREAWNYRLTGSEPEPITLGKVVGALFIFVVGWLAARVIARLIGSRILPGLRMGEGAAHAFESLAFYLLLLVVFLTALRMVQIPLTAFAVVGGALAIGVGFGSQNVVNNFISGIILLAERPIKRNDLVELQGIFGNVEQIGLRSTRVRTGDNIHIIVPNSSFLESNVVNWTHADPRVRLTLPVGVAYGSPVREVERLLERAVREQHAVLSDPAPIVLFVDFGDNALGFEIRFWIEMRTVLTRMQIESNLRYRITELFAEAGITIAFPQRDVHLDSLTPVEVRLVREPDPTAAQAGTRDGGADDREA